MRSTNISSGITEAAGGRREGRAAGYRAISLINLINAPAENKSRSHVGVHLFNFFAPFVLPRTPADINHAERRVVSPSVISVQKLICAVTRPGSVLKNANLNRRGIRARLVDTERERER